MSIANKILRVQLRDGALANFDPDRVTRAVAGAARSVGGFGQCEEPGVNDFLLKGHNEQQTAQILSDMVVMSLNADPRHHIPNFPPHIEEIQDMVIHVLRTYGFVDVADVYEAYRWGKHWIREGVIDEKQFVGNGFPEKRLAALLERNARWGCDTVAGLNELVAAGKLQEIIDQSIATYEDELDEAVATFERRKARGEDIRVITVAGPSSSGKTTTTVKLHQRLTRRGVPLVMMNLDHYFWPAHQHPVDWLADRDYETPHALDYHLINRHLHELLEGKEVQTPFYDFKLGDRIPGEKIKLPRGACLLLDCLHGLYPPLTAGIPESAKFRVYLENLNPIREGIGSTQRLVRFADVRLLRRMVRDQKHRNHSPLLTVLHWEKVRKSELANIIPLWGHADAVINGGFPLDLPALKPLVDGIYPSVADLARFPGRLDALLRHDRVRKLMQTVRPLPDEWQARIPGDALIREFIGGSTLKIPHND